MKTIILVLTIFSADGSQQQQIPIDLWKFATVAGCEQSSVFLNKGRNVPNQTYECVDRNDAIARAENPTLPKRKS